MPVTSLTSAYVSLRRALARILRPAVGNSEHPLQQAPTSQPDSSVLDLGVFEELRQSLDNQPDVVANIYRNFLINALARLRELRELPEEARARTLHALKGSAAMVGANRIAELAERLHASLLHRPAPPTDGALHELEDELMQFRRAVTAHIHSLGWNTAL